MKDIFEKDINRSINGVIKVNQLDEAGSQHIIEKQELEEYVITKELDKHFRQFFDDYTASLDAPTDKVGVWISGFFGSGKSHFLKILSYLLRNQLIDDHQALDYFEDKIHDPMLFGAMERAARVKADIILFNIDSKANASSKSDKEAIVKVFLKVFNEHLGYFGTDPAIAEFERNLNEKGHYEVFKEEFEKLSGSSWLVEREAWEFVHDDIVGALQASSGMSAAAAENLVASIDKDYNISVESFALLIKKYLSKQSPEHRLVFMVDEVGQYIGENSDLMLNLQTVSEDLGTHCAGRAWVVVTSQEDIDAVTQGKVKSYDFSKIQGRYKNRISLSSSHTDEVIRLRLLKKTETAKAQLSALYEANATQLNNQIRFSEDTAAMPGFRTADEFVASYPFVPYQFTLLQNVFTKIREMGATGKHLASGERSMLEAFQLAAQQLEGQALGGIAPFYTFYNAIEGSLDTVVTQAFERAGSNDQLSVPLDVNTLKILFMIRYVKELSGNVENLTTLSLNDINQDRLALKKEIEGAVQRLERQTLIQRQGDAYVFLTNEEQDISRELKSAAYNPDPSEVSKELQRVLWTYLYSDKEFKLDKQHSYKFIRKFDDAVYLKQEGDIELHLVSPYGDHYMDLNDDNNCRTRTSVNNEVLVRLSDDDQVFVEASEYLRTNSYISRKNSGGISAQIKTILQGLSDENTRRATRIRNLLSQRILEADIFVRGDKLEKRTLTSVTDVLNLGLRTLVENTYSKLSHVQSPFLNEAEIEQAFTSHTSNPTIDGHHPNYLAHDSMLNWLSEQDRYNSRVSLRSLINQFASAPYGWAERDTVGVLAELVNQQKAELRHPNDPVDVRQAGIVKTMLLKSGLDSFTIHVPRTVNPQALKVARDLAKETFDVASLPHEPAALHDFFKDRLKSRLENTQKLKSEASRGNYPYEDELEHHLSLLNKLLRTDSTASFFDLLRENEDAFEDMAGNYERISTFFKAQVRVFDDTKSQLESIRQDARHLQDEALKQRIQDAERILSLPDPSREVPKLNNLLSPVSEYLAAEQERIKADALNDYQNALTSLMNLMTEKALPQDLSAPIFSSFESLKQELSSVSSIDAALAVHASIAVREQQARQALIDAYNSLLQNTTHDQSTPNARPIRMLKPAQLNGFKVLKSEEDVESYLSELQNNLRKLISEGFEIHLE